MAAHTVQGSGHNIMQKPDQATSVATAKGQRILACTLCQSRKIKCDRKFPCGNCVKASAQCVPASLLPRQRRRRYPERELLERLRHYEHLLRRNNIHFEPLHPTSSTSKRPDDGGTQISRRNDQEDAGSASLARGKSERTSPGSDTEFEVKNIWHAMNHRTPDDDDDDDHDEDEPLEPVESEMREAVIKKAWDQMVKSNDSLLFGLTKTNIRPTTLHPQQVQIIRLWQIFLENVNPLLKVLHPPSMQMRIIEAASSIADVDPVLEALMFSIYCMAIHSLSDEDCLTRFASAKEDLLRSYHFGCQQALLNCEFLRTTSRECLTALHLYLISVRPYTDARSLSSILGAAMRVAQRMNLQRESFNVACDAFEAEMRRRLWWSLVLFDRRIGEMSDFKTSLLDPTWNCKLPLNTNDSDFGPETKTAPIAHERSADAVFAVVRGELGDFSRHNALHLDFTNPLLKAIARKPPHGSASEGDEVAALERMIEDKYLRHCNPENPLHYITIWTARGQIAKAHLMKHFARSTNKPAGKQTDTVAADTIPYCLAALECDTKLLTSPIAQGFRWLTEMHFQFPAYGSVLQDLKKRPSHELASRAWQVLSESYQARKMYEESAETNPFFKEFARMVLTTWETCEKVLVQSDQTFEVPYIVADMKSKNLQVTPSPQHDDEPGSMNLTGMELDEYSVSAQIDIGGFGMPFGTDGLIAGNVDVNQIDWNAMDLNATYTPGWWKY